MRETTSSVQSARAARIGRQGGRQRLARRARSIAAASLAAVFALSVAGVVVPSAAQAADPVGCNYAQSGTGRYADTICWVDFSGFNNAAARSPGGQPMSISLPGGYTATFVVQARPVAGFNDVSSCIASEPIPFWTYTAGPPSTTWPMGGIAYRGIGGRPGLVNSNGVAPGTAFPAACHAANSAADLILSNIEVRDAAGQSIAGYGIVSTEAEASTDVGGEGIVWRSDRTLSLFETINGPNVSGGCIGGRVTGFGTDTVTCVGQRNQAGRSYGTSLILAESPTFFSTASMRPSGILGTMYGFVTSKVRLNKVADRLWSPSDSFDLAVRSAATTLGSGSTNGGLTGTTGEVTVLTGGSFDLAETGASGTDLANYDQSWTCDRNGTNDPSLSSSGGTSKPVSPDVGDFIDCTVTNTLKPADLSIDKRATSSPAFPDQNLTYDLVVRNNGSGAAHNVSVSDSLPADVAYVSSSSGCSLSGSTVECRLGSLAVGASHTFTVTVRVAASAEGTLSNTATTTSETPDPNPGNNRDEERVPVEPLADLSIVKRALSDRLVPGRQLTYELTVFNDGPSTARDVRMSDPLPSGLSFVSASSGCAFADGTVTCTAATLASGRSITYRVVTRVAASVKESSISNTATVVSTTRDPDPGNNRDREQVPSGPEADLSIAKIPSVDRVAVGGQLFYTLLIRNDGPSDAQDVVVADTAGAGLTLLSARGSQGASCTVAAARVTCRLGTLAVGGSAQVLVSARADQAGGLTNRATVDSTTEDPDPSDNRDERRVTGDPPPTVNPQPADLEIVKTANRRSVLGSGTITYTLRVRNLGPGTATDVQVVDTPSLRVKVRSVRSSVGRCTTSAPVRCSLGTLQSGATATIRIVAQPLAAGTLRNSASVTGNEPDPRAENNIDGASVKVQGLLKISKVASTEVVRAGGTLTYKIRVTNASSFALRSVRVCDDLPAGLVFVSSTPSARLSGGRHCWTIRTLGATQSKTFTLKARVLRGSGGRKVNVATVTAPNARGARSRAATGTATIRVLPGAARGGGVTG